MELSSEAIDPNLRFQGVQTSNFIADLPGYPLSASFLWEVLTTFTNGTTYTIQNNCTYLAW